MENSYDELIPKGWYRREIFYKNWVKFYHLIYQQWKIGQNNSNYLR